MLGCIVWGRSTDLGESTDVIEGLGAGGEGDDRG